MALSERQTKILEFIKSFTLESGYPPTIREIGEAVGISSTSVVNYNLNVLQREGLICRDKTVSRGIRLSEDDRQRNIVSHLIAVPLLGHIAAGEPIDVPEGAYTVDEENMIQVSQDLVPDRDVFALQVKGTSMIDALINDGDIVIMKPAVEAHNGEMVAVWLTDRDETTLKRFYNEGNRIRLQPENVTMDPIYVDPGVVQVQGRVVAVVRSLN
jgi:repressor LexA